MMHGNCNISCSAQGLDQGTHGIGLAGAAGLPYFHMRNLWTSYRDFSAHFDGGPSNRVSARAVWQCLLLESCKSVKQQQPAVSPLLGSRGSSADIGTCCLLRSPTENWAID